MNIFNSLGSNYTFGFALKALLANNDDKYRDQLIGLLEKKYGWRALLFYKGRHALELALRLANLPKNSLVAVTGLTCVAVEDSVREAGYKAVYLDIDKSLNFTPVTLERELKKNALIKAVIIQNTLGFPCDAEEIAKLCKKHKIILIEDLAHSIGAVYSSGKEAGTIGDFTTLSFSQDKIIDGVSGGALVIRKSNYLQSILENLITINTQQHRDRFYPLFTYLIRSTYGSGAGKLLHGALKTLDVLPRPLARDLSSGLYTLGNWYCKLIVEGFKSLDSNLEHRRAIAQIYAQTLDSSISSKETVDKISDSANLRFPIFVENRKDLIKYLKKRGIFVSDIWYDAPVAPRNEKSGFYKDGICPQAEKIAKTILNLPTHRNVSEADAKRIAEFVNEWIKV